MFEKRINLLQNRRNFFTKILTFTLAALSFPIKIHDVHATTADVDTLVNAKLNGISAKIGKITLDMPEVAENGASVQFTITVESPMTEQDYVKEIHLFTEGNVTPQVASYYLTPYSGKAQLTSRLRLARKQYVRVLATMSDGSAYIAHREVTVAVGGC